MDKRELEITLALAMLEMGETERMEQGVEEMLGHFEKMMAVDVSDLAPTTHPLVKENRTREDVSRAYNDTESLLENGPETSDRFFVIPNVL